MQLGSYTAVTWPLHAVTQWHLAIEVQLGGQPRDALLLKLERLRLLSPLLSRALDAFQPPTQARLRLLATGLRLRVLPVRVMQREGEAE